MRLYRILCVAVLFIVLSVSRAFAGEEPAITADAAILIEATTGRVIWEKNAEEQRYPASMTKMMTAILSLERLGPNREIMISPEAAATEDTPLGIKEGERLTAEQLTYGMMMVSDNGAAVALAEEMDGSVKAFAKKMNAKAAEIGMKNTHFANPNGLPNKDHYSTAHDMARLARYAMENKRFQTMVDEPYGTIYWLYPRGQYLAVKNTNELLGVYDGITGIKTGWTNDAGGCLAASATRNGVELIAVVMHSTTGKNRFSDARKILDYGFQNVKMVRGLAAKDAGRLVYVAGGKSGITTAYPVTDVEYPLVGGEDPSHYSLSYEVPRMMPAPIGDSPVGKIIINYDGKPIGAIDMKAEKVEKGFSVGSLLVSIFGWML